MQDFASFQADQENAEFGRWLIETIANNIGVEAKPERIDRAIYKGTDCGAWVRFDEQGVMVGTIVEGSDAEFSKRIQVRDLANLENPEKILLERFWNAVQEAEDFSSQVWAEKGEEDFI